MTSLLRIFCLELTALVRTWTAQMLVLASLAWFVAADRLLVADSTAEGHREMLVRYGLGGVFAILVVALLSAATGAIASEREARRLQLTQVRPVSAFSVAWGKFLALAAVGAVALAPPCAILALSPDSAGRRCHHVSRPVMESPRAEAEKMYDIYMADPETPPEAKKAKKAVVLRLLEQRAKDNYLPIQTNETVSWTFPVRNTAPSSVRLRFSNDFDMREDVRGEIAADGLCGVVSNITKTAVTVPLRRSPVRCEPGVLTFRNTGAGAVMLRPRQDVELLSDADSFAWNMLRAYVVMLSVLSLAVAFGVFLGAGLSRPVALFTAIVFLAVGEISPTVVDQYPDQLETDLVDSVGLAVTRVVERSTRPVSALSPLSLVAGDDCVEPSDAAAAFALDFALLPALLCAMAAFLVRRKQEQ